MNKLLKIVLGAILITLGWLALALGFAEPLGGYNGYVFLSGFVLIGYGIFFIVRRRKNR